MEPLTVEVLEGVNSAITETSTRITAFVKEVRSARAKLDSTSRELLSLKTVLELLADDIADPSFPGTLKGQIAGIARNCMVVVMKVEALFTNHEGSGLSKAAQWARGGEEECEKLRRSLEMHTSALEISLEMVALITTRETRGNTQDILHDPAEIRCNHSQILAEISRLQKQLPQETGPDNRSGFVLEKFLDDLTTWAETIIYPFPDGVNNLEFKESALGSDINSHIGQLHGSRYTSKSKRDDDDSQINHSHLSKTPSMQITGTDGFRRKAIPSHPEPVVRLSANTSPTPIGGVCEAGSPSLNPSSKLDEETIKIAVSEEIAGSSQETMKIAVPRENREAPPRRKGSAPSTAFRSYENAPEVVSYGQMGNRSMNVQAEVNPPLPLLYDEHFKEVIYQNAHRLVRKSREKLFDALGHALQSLGIQKIMMGKDDYGYRCQEGVVKFEVSIYRKMLGTGLLISKVYGMHRRELAQHEIRWYFDLTKRVQMKLFQALEGGTDRPMTHSYG